MPARNFLAGTHLIYLNYYFPPLNASIEKMVKAKGAFQLIATSLEA
jgi:hypothetical protein